KNVEIVEADALSGPKKGLPLPVHAALQLAAQEGLTPICVSNFPYAIATPFIVKLLEAALIEEAFPLERIAGTVQLEVADRLRAKTITKDYGAPSALVQALAEVTLTRRLGPNAFWPPPKVSSAVINVEPRAAKDRPDAAEWPGYLGLVRGLFQLRRKTIRNGLIRKLGLTAPQAERALAAAEVDHRARVETLDVTTLRRLARACRPALAAPETPPPTPDPPSRP
ncbi:MAG: ribosomal RNA small subunit methyltransferase A, partial [Planctomycetota bacterium]